LATADPSTSKSNSAASPSGKSSKTPAYSKLSPAIGSSLRNWLASLLAFGPPSWRYLPRTFFVTLVSAVGIPFRWYESFALREKLKATKLKEDPVFIIGHWRTGTTFLHNLMTRDPQFGYITMHQALFPRSFMSTGFFRWFLKVFMPPTRPMDNMKLDVDMPQEDELALSNWGRFSLYNGWHFPWRLMDFYRRWVEFDGISDAGRSAWWREFNRVLIRATLNHGGKRLVLKNPPHTARIIEILKRYPNARFIHIYRNPYVVYLSTRHLYKTAIPPFNVQNYPALKMERDFLQIYRRMMLRFFELEKIVPEDRLFSIRYEDFAEDPLPTLQRAYTHLGIEGWEEAEPTLNTYLKTLGGYRKNRYNMSEEDIATVQRHWGFAIDRWGYSVPD
jgi:hypothetical protein